MNRISKTLALALGAILMTAQVATAFQDAPRREKPWDKDVVQLFAELPVQDGGRVKPLSTLAGFKLLKMNGKRKLTTPADEKIKHTEWLLDCMFFREQAREYETFLIQNDEVLKSVGHSIEGKKKRDRYSYNSLAPARSAIFQKAETLAHKEQGDQSPVERQLVALAVNLRDFEDLTHFLDFANHPFPLSGSAELKKIYGDVDEVPLSSALAKIGDVRDFYMKSGRDGTPQDDPDVVAAVEIFRRLEFFMQSGAGGLLLLPPELPLEQTTEWARPSDLIPKTLQETAPFERHIELLAALEKMAQSPSDQVAFKAELEKFSAGAVSLADARGEYSKIPLEVRFYKYDFFFNSLYLYVATFLLVALSWMSPGNRWLQYGIWSFLTAGTGLLVLGIVMRCIIRSRPPVSTLYETILFITAGCVLVSIFIEYLDRQRIALAVAAILGVGGMFLSTKYELKEAASAGDTMPSLVAVLDTNFWLSTHVTTVTLGYSAGLLAAAIAMVWIFGRLFGLRRGDNIFYRKMARMVYGVLCFGLLFSVVGTILGGIWANYSWGRFWGWDPKENGALLICLWELMILHARMGGYIRDRGLCNLAVLGGCVVAFSWWGVNLLGIGLHSYGFTTGVFRALMAYYIISGGIVLTSGLHWLILRQQASDASSDFSSGAPVAGGK